MSDGKYFQTTKRGELRELKEELHNSNKDKKKDAVKKVIASMTLGKDVSELFPDVVNCMQTTNIELKKLVYLYVINYAKAQPELAILAINTFRKDSLDPNPLIRALAVRTMGCIRLQQITEYLVDPLRRCCKDTDPYVRKTASLCIAKVHDISPELVEEQGFIAMLKDMLGDSNPMVVANTVAALSEISDNAGKNYLELNEITVSKILAALNECTEWGQVFILDAVAQYTPSSSKEAESILERITARLSHANAAVVLSAIKVVLLFLDHVNNPESARILQKKLSPPLVTLLSGEPEVQYVALRNINLIIQHRPNILTNEVKMFFCKFTDPVYVKTEKIDILVKLVTERTVELVLMELKEYATEVDVEFVRKAVRALGLCAVKLAKAAERCIAVLLELVEARVSYVVQEAVIVIRDIFRKYPNRYEAIISVLCDNLDTLDEPEAKAAMIWIIGEYAERIDNADELLDTFLNSFHDEPVTVQLQTLTAAVKVFLKLPGHSQGLVTRALKLSTEETDNPDLRDRGYIYWRMLSLNPEQTKQVVLCHRSPISEESYSLDPQLLNKLIGDISTLASVYHKLPHTFVVKMKGRHKYTGIDGDDEDRDAVDLSKVKDKIQAQGEYDSGGDDDGDVSSPDSDASSSDQPNDLLDTTSRTKAPSPPPMNTNKTVLLNPNQAGAKGGTGLMIKGALISHQGHCWLQLNMTNKSSQPLSSWAIQLNKNPFGLGPKLGLTMGEVVVDGSGDADILLSPGAILSGTPATIPMGLQIAVKCSLDVFYFTCAYDFGCVLKGNISAVDKDTFKQTWTKLGDTKQLSLMATAGAPLPSASVVHSLGAVGVNLVAQRTADTFESLYLSCQTVTDEQLFAEISVQRNGNGVKVVVRSENINLAPLFHNLMVKLFNLQTR
eukprot:GHVR01090104.1.p1 GENE.GHVR01090104.1~~GHVR01090104.1.p1  ORF type:complete len:900 (-),score=178.13 GHVR01090104.1:53-2752(-)